MKSIKINKFGGPEVLELVETKESTVSKNEIKVRLYAAGLNPNESYIISGTYAYLIPELPYTPGFDGAGIVEEVGERVKNVREGDRVFVAAFTADKNTGTHAEKVVVDKEVVYSLPDNISFNEGAGLGIPAFAAFRSLFQIAKLKAGEIVLIHGASGAVGLLAVQMAKAIGAKVIGTSSTMEGQELIKKVGADYVIEHINSRNLDTIKEITQNKGPDVIIEMLANKNLENDLDIISKKGRIVVVGNRGEITINPRKLMTTEAIVTGLSITKLNDEDKREIIDGLTAFLKTGALRPVIGEKFKLDEAEEAYKELIDGHGNGRLIFEIK